MAENQSVLAASRRQKPADVYNLATPSRAVGSQGGGGIGQGLQGLGQGLETLAQSLAAQEQKTLMQERQNTFMERSLELSKMNDETYLQYGRQGGLQYQQASEERLGQALEEWTDLDPETRHSLQVQAQRQIQERSFGLRLQDQQKQEAAARERTVANLQMLGYQAVEIGEGLLTHEALAEQKLAFDQQVNDIILNDPALTREAEQARLRYHENLEVGFGKSWMSREADRVLATDGTWSGEEQEAALGPLAPAAKERLNPELNATHVKVSSIQHEQRKRSDPLILEYDERVGGWSNDAFVNISMGQSWSGEKKGMEQYAKDLARAGYEPESAQVQAVVKDMEREQAATKIVQDLGKPEAKPLEDMVGEEEVATIIKAAYKWGDPDHPMTHPWRVAYQFMRNKVGEYIFNLGKMPHTLLFETGLMARRHDNERWIMEQEWEIVKGLEDIPVHTKERMAEGYDVLASLHGQSKSQKLEEAVEESEFFIDKGAINLFSLSMGNLFDMASISDKAPSDPVYERAAVIEQEYNMLNMGRVPSEAEVLNMAEGFSVQARDRLLNFRLNYVNRNRAVQELTYNTGLAVVSQNLQEVSNPYSAIWSNGSAPQVIRRTLDVLDALGSSQNANPVKIQQIRDSLQAHAVIHPDLLRYHAMSVESIVSERRRIMSSGMSQEERTIRLAHLDTIAEQVRMEDKISEEQRQELNASDHRSLVQAEMNFMDLLAQGEMEDAQALAVRGQQLLDQLDMSGDYSPEFIESKRRMFDAELEARFAEEKFRQLTPDYQNLMVSSLQADLPDTWTIQTRDAFMRRIQPFLDQNEAQAKGARLQRDGLLKQAKTFRVPSEQLLQLAASGTLSQQEYRETLFLGQLLQTAETGGIQAVRGMLNTAITPDLYALGEEYLGALESEIARDAAGLWLQRTPENRELALRVASLSDGINQVAMLAADGKLADPATAMQVIDAFFSEYSPIQRKVFTETSVLYNKPAAFPSSVQQVFKNLLASQAQVEVKLRLMGNIVYGAPDLAENVFEEMGFDDNESIAFAGAGNAMLEGRRQAAKNILKGLTYVNEQGGSERAPTFAEFEGAFERLGLHWGYFADGHKDVNISKLAYISLRGRMGQQQNWDIEDDIMMEAFKDAVGEVAVNEGGYFIEKPSYIPQGVWQDVIDAVMKSPSGLLRKALPDGVDLGENPARTMETMANGIWHQVEDGKYIIYDRPVSLVPRTQESFFDTEYEEGAVPQPVLDANGQPVVIDIYKLRETIRGRGTPVGAGGIRIGGREFQLAGREDQSIYSEEGWAEMMRLKQVLENNEVEIERWGYGGPAVARVNGVDVNQLTGEAVGDGRISPVYQEGDHEQDSSGTVYGDMIRYFVPPEEKPRFHKATGTIPEKVARAGGMHPRDGEWRGPPYRLPRGEGLNVSPEDLMNLPGEEFAEIVLTALQSDAPEDLMNLAGQKFVQWDMSAPQSDRSPDDLTNLPGEKHGWGKGFRKFKYDDRDPFRSWKRMWGISQHATVEKLRAMPAKEFRKYVMGILPRDTRTRPEWKETPDEKFKRLVMATMPGVSQKDAQVASQGKREPTPAREPERVGRPNWPDRRRTRGNMIAESFKKVGGDGELGKWIKDHLSGPDLESYEYQLRGKQGADISKAQANRLKKLPVAQFTAWKNRWGFPEDLSKHEIVNMHPNTFKKMLLSHIKRDLQRGGQTTDHLFLSRVPGKKFKFLVLASLPE